MTYPERVIADGAAAYWRLGEKSGTTAVDVVGGANGTISGGVTLNQQGAIADGNKAMLFNGVDGRILTTQNVALTPPFTIELWARGTPFADCAAFSNGSGGSVDLIYLGQTAGHLRLYVEHAAGGTTSAVGTRVINDNQWHHLVGVFQAATLTAYLDGVVDVSVPTTAALVGSTTRTAQIGYVTGYPSHAWPGLVDEVALYPTALTVDQIRAHYLLGTGDTMSNTVVPNEYLLGTQNAPVTTGTGNWCAVVGGPISLAVTTTMVGAVSAGTILIEHTDDPQDGSIGTMAQLASIAAAGGPGKLVTNISRGSFGYVRARISAAITGGSAYVEIVGW